MQLWVALPDGARHGAPGSTTTCPIPWPATAAEARVFLGTLLGRTSPVPTATPLLGAELRLDAGAELHLDVDPALELGVLVDTGTVSLAPGNGVSTEVAEHRLGFVPPGRGVLGLRAHDAPVRLLLLGGPPLGERIVMWWNFVGRSHDEVAEAGPPGRPSSRSARVEPWSTTPPRSPPGASASSPATGCRRSRRPGCPTPGCAAGAEAAGRLAGRVGGGPVAVGKDAAVHPLPTSRLRRPSRRRTLRPTGLAAALLVGAVALTGCSGSDPDPDPASGEDASADGSPSAGEDPADDPAAVVRDSVDATLAAEAFSADGELALTIGGQDLSVAVDGSVDYADVVSDVTLRVQQAREDGQAGTTTIDVRSDGTHVWLRQQQLAGQRWVQGDADRLSGSSTFEPSGLVGAVIVLRGAEDVTEGEPTEVDGVAARTFTTTIAYTDAVDAAGDDADALESSFNLTGQATSADLDVEVAVGEDGVVRDLTFEVDAGDLPVSGGYELRLRDVGDAVEPPAAPPAGQTVTGPRAERLLDQAIS